MQRTAAPHPRAGAGSITRAQNAEKKLERSASKKKAPAPAPAAAPAAQPASAAPAAAKPGKKKKKDYASMTMGEETTVAAATDEFTEDMDAFM